MLRGRFREGEPVIVLVARGIGATQPYEFRDRDGRSFLLKWEGKLEGHVLRVPWHVWMADGGRLADGVMNQRRLPFALVVLVEWAKQGEIRMTKEDEGEECGDGEGQAGVPASLEKGEAGVVVSLSEGDVLCYSRMRVMLGGGALRLRALGWALDVGEVELRAMLERADCPAMVTATGWVKLRDGVE